MMGTKQRRFAPLINVSVEELVPQDHFYRHLERTLDLSFVREFVHETYASAGRPSIDPVVFFKLQLVMFFEDIRSERLLMRHAADRLSVRWYLGYDLNEPLPDHSSLTRIRERYGVAVFRRFFEKIVEQCQAAGLVWGKELYFDGTKVAANAGKESLKPRFFVEAHLADLFGAETEELPEETEQQTPQTEAVGSRPVEQEETPLPTQLPASLVQEDCRWAQSQTVAQEARLGASPGATRSGQCLLSRSIRGADASACPSASSKSFGLWSEASGEELLDTPSGLEYPSCFRSLSSTSMGLLS
jgi:transposase